MAEIPLTKFVDFVAKAGTPKYTVVKQTKQLIDEAIVHRKICGNNCETELSKYIRTGSP